MFFEEENEEKNENAKGSEALLGKLLETRQIILSGEVNKALAEKVVNQLLILDAASDEPIYVYIDSPGGDVDSGYAIFDMMRFVKSPVITVGMGLVASAGALIFLASPKERRIALPNSHYLIHQPLSGMKGVATDIEIHAQELEKAKEKINLLISEETGVKLEQVKKDTERDYWMNAQEALEYGLAGKIVSKRSEL